MTCCRENAEYTQAHLSLIPVKIDEDFHYIGRDGRIEIGPLFSDASLFRGGMALVKGGGKNGKWGFISEAGKFTLAPNYVSATVFSEGLAWVVEENRSPSAINAAGEIRVNLPKATAVRIFREGLAAFSQTENGESLWGFVDANGMIKIKPSFPFAGEFAEGRCRIKSAQGKWGYIDEDGREIIPAQFDSVTDFSGKTAVVFQGGLAGLINQQGEFLLKPQFAGLRNDGAQCLFKKDNKWGWMDHEGKIILSPRFENAFPFFGNELAAVQSGKKWGYANREGIIRIEAKYDSAFPFDGDLAMVMVDGKTGFINQQGKYHVRPRFDAASDDLAAHFLHLNSKFNEAESDLFEVSNISRRISLSQPEGFPLLCQFSELIAKFPVKKKSLDSLTADGLSLNEHLLFSGRKITGEANLDFTVFANVYKVIPDEEKPMLIYNPDVPNSAYKYTIKLTGRGLGKEKSIVEALEKNLKDMKKNETLSEGSASFFSNKSCMVEFKHKPGTVTILITPKNAVAVAVSDEKK